MDFKDQIKQLADRITKSKERVATEEATKAAFVMPMIKILGYDVFDPHEVIPEYICDIGTKKGEKIDYAILHDEKPLILIECKHWNKNLNLHEGQLLRYFNVSHAAFAVLTNGIIYRFYTDLDRPNVLDDKPFWEINITNCKDSEIDKLQKFHKSVLNVEEIFTSAVDSKYMNEIMSIISSEMVNPTDWFVRAIARQVLSPSGKMVTAKVIEQFTSFIKQAFSQVINDMVTERLKTALSREEEASRLQDTITTSQDGIVTTEEELEGFYTVRAVLHGSVDLDRVVYRDTLSYFGILLDDNNRLPICRLHFNSSQKYIEIFDENKKGTRFAISRVADVGNYKDAMVKSIQTYDAARKSGNSFQNIEPEPVDAEPTPSDPDSQAGTKGIIEWYYFNATDERIGPIDSQTLVTLAASGEIKPETRIETSCGRKGVARKVKGLVFPQ